MARAGEKIHNPVQGDSIVFRGTAQDTGGELMSGELVVSPRGGTRCTSILSKRSISKSSPAPSVCRWATSKEALGREKRRLSPQAHPTGGTTKPTKRRPASWSNCGPL